MKTARLTAVDISTMKQKHERIVSLTAYDYTSAQMLDAAGIHMILVGDTLGMVVQGEETTLPVSIDDMLYHARMVTRGARRALVVADMPFMSYQVSVEDALRNAGRLMKEAHVGAVKIEGGAGVAPLVERLTQIGIPVCGHLGFTPQSTHTLGGPRVQGRTVTDAAALIADAQSLSSAGAFAIVLELVPASLAEEITQRVRVPTIGIGSGPACDGEIQVFHDLFGLYTDFQPRHTRRYLNIAEQLTAAAVRYREDVIARRFPGPEQTTDLKPDVKEELREFLRRSGGAVKSLRTKASHS
ncbi:MAG TPA: 3-methyl-2-oxobutanoate hydroxymethyltransferase [Burkholderiales bacterium]